MSYNWIDVVVMLPLRNHKLAYYVADWMGRSECKNCKGRLRWWRAYFRKTVESAESEFELPDYPKSRFQKSTSHKHQNASSHRWNQKMLQKQSLVAFLGNKANINSSIVKIGWINITGRPNPLIIGFRRTPLKSAFRHTCAINDQRNKIIIGGIVKSNNQMSIIRP